MNLPNTYPVPPGPMQPTPELTPWFFVIGLENEYWFDGGHCRAEAVAAARQEIAIRERETKEKINLDDVAIAPGRRATQLDVDEWMGDEDIELGRWIVDEDKIEDFPAEFEDQGEPGPGI